MTTPTLKAETLDQITILHESPFIKVIAGGSYGSGTYIGNGYFLTAAHVVVNHEGVPYTKVHIQTEAGTTIDAYVVAITKADIAIVRIIPTPEMLLSFSAVDINCSGYDIGTHVELHGNPVDMPPVYMNGEIIGKPQVYDMWPEVVPVDGMILWGMSGGGAINDEGELVGVNVAIHVIFGGSLAIPGIGYIVPSNVVCDAVTYYGFDLDGPTQPTSLENMNFEFSPLLFNIK